MRRNTGLTFIEVVIASAILIIVILAIYLVMHSASNEYANQSVHLALDERARDTLAQMVREIRNAGGTITPAAQLLPGDPGFDKSGSPPKPRYTDLTLGLLSGTVLKDPVTKMPKNVFGDQVRYRWVLEPSETLNGTDDNRNGLTDEGYIEKTEKYGTKPPVVTKICSDVTRQGLVFEVDPANPKAVVIRLTLQRRDTNRTLITRTAETTAVFRN